MLLNKILVIGILLVCAGSVSAWDYEGGIGEEELFDIMFNSAYMYTTDENPRWYDPRESINDLFVSFEGYFTHTPPEIEARVLIKKMIWTGSYYVEDTSFVDLDSSTYFQFKVNATETVQVPVYKHMQEVFNNNPDEYENFTTVTEDNEHPDVLNFTVSVGTDGDALDFEGTGSITFTDAGLLELESNSEGIDYGFVDSGRGSDGGSGSIYTGINLYGGTGGDGDAEGMGYAFNMLFYILIPILFMLCVLQFVFGLF